MAHETKGQRGAVGPGKVPAAVDIRKGDILTFHGYEGPFDLEVLSLQHDGEWIFGWDTRAPLPRVLGPVAVMRVNCRWPVQV